MDPTGLDCYSRSGPQARDSGSCSGNYGPPEYGGVSIDGGSAFSAGLFGSGSGGGGGESAVQCPNNSCSAISSYFLPVQFSATVTSSFWSCTLAGTWSSELQAAAVATGCARGESIAMDAELYGNIQKTANGQFTFSLAQIGDPGASPAYFVVPADSTLVAFYHDHGAPTAPPYPEEMFSNADTDNAFRSRIDSWVGTPAGRLLFYMPYFGPELMRGCVAVGQSYTLPPGVSTQAATGATIPVCPASALQP